MLPIILVSVPGCAHVIATKQIYNRKIDEEIQNALTVIPLSTGNSMLLNSTLVVAMLIA